MQIVILDEIKRESSSNLQSSMQTKGVRGTKFDGEDLMFVGLPGTVPLVKPFNCSGSYYTVKKRMKHLSFGFLNVKDKFCNTAKLKSRLYVIMNVKH